MRILLLSWFLFVANVVTMLMVLVSGRCQVDQQSLLLQMKRSLMFDSSSSTHLVQWSPSKDCCTWSGVGCDEAGHVISLDLCDESISGGIENATGLFGLKHLQSLNLARNRFNGRQIPSTLAKLTNLTYLNLSNSEFSGQIPHAISDMTRLIILDLSCDYISSRLKLEKPNLSVIVQNLTDLRELYLDGVNLSSSKNEWCQALSSSLPHLQVLSLSRCSLSGPIHASLASLRSLSKIDLSHNNLSSPVPEFLADYVNLTSLSLQWCGLHGKFPEKIFQVPILETLDLSSNELLEGFLPEFPKNASLRTLIISSALPCLYSSRISCSGNFGGPIPNSMANLTQLFYLDLSCNNFTGSIPSFRLSKNLNYLDLSYNPLTGAISSTRWEELSNLVYVDLSHNSLSGRIPPSLFELRNLQTLYLSFNNLNGSIQLDKILSHGNLTNIDLSYNKLEVDVSSDPSFPFQIRELRLASCNLSIFPNLKNRSMLWDLDLSNNKLFGKIPSWVWEIGGNLNLSHNHLVGLQEPYSIHDNIFSIDLHSNLLQGQIPYLPFVYYADYSSNKFSSIPADNITDFSSCTSFFSLANNSLKGDIPKVLCHLLSVQVLDLSNNNFSGTIPGCLFEESRSLDVVNLGRNNLNGSIPDNFPIYCGLRTLNLNGNHLEGMVPRSLSNCTNLELLDLGNNHIIDEFPCWLQNVSSIRALVLQSNKFFGKIGCLEINNSWPMLQIIDLSSNNFSGRLPQKSLTNWKPMTLNADKAQSQFKHDIRVTLSGQDGQLYYQDAITIINKGLKMELGRSTLSLYNGIDLSCNHFQGPIPKEIGVLKSLYILNLSHNHLIGQIPSSIGNLRELESFDLSSNNLSGVIPLELANLNFLSVLNLSYNHLVGRIPSSTQLQSFSPTSFEGNEGLCGPPLLNNCTNSIIPTVTVSTEEIDWRFILMAIGFAIGFGATVTPLMFSEKVNKWYDKSISKFLRWISR